MITIIQCRADTDAIEGAAISNSPPQIQPTVPICQHSLIRFRSGGGSIVARAKTLVSPSTPCMTATTMAATPAAWINRSRKAIDKRRVSYVEGLLRASGIALDDARIQAQILYWTYLGFALSDRPLSPAQQRAVVPEMLRMALR